LKQHENNSKKIKSKYCETFIDIIDYGHTILYCVILLAYVGLGQFTGQFVIK